jgi:hypothetical protein
MIWGLTMMGASRFVILVAVLALASPCGAQQCSDGIDNNANGLIDLTDWYCRDPADNDESSFHSAIPGDDGNAPASLDCWFDGNTGSGDDGCSIHACCDIDGACPADLEPALFDANQCSVSGQCAASCVPLTKPGCDCFGCCEICTPQNGCLNVFVNPAVSPTCTLESLGDPSSCKRCVQNPACLVPYVIFANGFEGAPPLAGSLADALGRATR